MNGMNVSKISIYVRGSTVEGQHGSAQTQVALCRELLRRQGIDDDVPVQIIYDANCRS